MMSPDGVFFFVVVFAGILLLLGAAFYVLSRIFARAGGWSELAALYAATQQPAGETATGQHCRVGPVRYRNCTTIGVSQAGLYLSVTAPVIGEHPPLLIPWSAVSSIKRTRLYWLGAVQLGIGRPQITTLTVLNKVFEPMRPYVSRWLPDL